MALSLIQRDPGLFSGRFTAAGVVNYASLRLGRGSDFGGAGVLASVSAFRGDLEFAIESHRGADGQFSVQRTLQALILGE